MRQAKKKTSKWKSVLRMILLIVCGAVVGVNVYLANANSLVGDQLPMPFGYGAAVVLSGSMEPEFSQGDLIVVKEADTYAANDIVVYQDGGSLVVHRIVGLNGETVTTKGDANSVVDAPVSLSAIKGKVLFWIPFAGRAVSFLKTPVGTIAVIAVAIALVEIPRRKEKERDDAERQEIIDEIRRLKDEQQK